MQGTRKGMPSIFHYAVAYFGCENLFIFKDMIRAEALKNKPNVAL